LRERQFHHLDHHIARHTLGVFGVTRFYPIGHFGAYGDYSDTHFIISNLTGNSR
jgi:hypothetical protein